MPGMGKHVHHTSRHQDKAMLVHQDTGVACEAGRMTGNVDQARGTQAGEGCYRVRGACAWGLIVADRTSAAPSRMPSLAI